MTTDNDSTTPQNHTQDTPTRRKRENATIIRAAHSETGKFFLLVRATAQDHRLSPEALGVLVELLSRSDDWVVQVTQLSKRHKLGREKCYRILKELTAAGYMVRTMVRDDHGKVVRVEYVVHEVSQGEAEPLPEKPDTAKQEAEKPNTENPDTEKQHITDTRIAQETESTSMPAAKAAAKRKKSKANPRSAELEPDIIYETVETHIFGIEGTPDMPYQWSGRCGQITSWLKGAVASVDGQEVGKISRPAAPEHIKAFARAWVKEHTGAPLPRKPDRFVEHWRAWASKQAGARPRANLQEATPEDKAALVREYVA